MDYYEIECSLDECDDLDGYKRREVAVASMDADSLDRLIELEDNYSGDLVF